ncbi:MAG: hypothetical protein NXH95_15830 [Pseudomonadaceae bacterium]|nr:hypothetical protein [Pseudomonadaceae bacterium]
MSAKVIQSWMDGSVKTADSGLLSAVLRAYKEIPEHFWRGNVTGKGRTALKSAYEDITEGMRNALLEEKRRTNVTPFQLLKGSVQTPDGLNPRIIDQWLNGLKKKAKKHHLAFVLDAYEALPDRDRATAHQLRPTSGRPVQRSADRVKITDEMRAEIRSIHSNSPMGYLKDHPHGLTPTKMCHIVSGRNKTIDRNALEFLRNISG